MKMKRVISLLLCATMVTGLAAIAATTDSSSTSSSSNSNAPTQIESNYIGDFLKSSGFSDANGGNLKASDFEKSAYEIWFTEDQRSEIESLSKTADLRGITSSIATTLYVAQKQYPSGDRNFTVAYGLFMDIKTGMVDAAVALRIPNRASETTTPLYAMTKGTFSLIQSDVAKFIQEYAFLPKTKAAQASLISGYRVESADNTALQTFWSQKGWDTKGWTFYQNEDGSDTKAYLTDEEITLAMKASGNGGPQVAMIMPSYGYYFIEKAYKIKGSDERFYVDFIASGINLSAKELGANFSFLVVKPAKIKADGTVDKFFYPADTKISVIVKDITKYYADASK